MSNNGYQRYYTPLAGNVLVLPFEETRTSQFIKAELGAEGEYLGEGWFTEELMKGVVVERGKDNPNDPHPMVKQKDVVLFPRQEGLVIKIATQSMAGGGYQEREYRVLSLRAIIAVL